MTLRAYRLGIRLLTFFAVLAWGSVVFFVDPEAAGRSGMLLFFGTLFVALLGLCTLFVTWTYVRGLGEEGAAHNLGSAFRQAFLLALYAVGNVALFYLKAWAWWASLLYLVFLLLIEFTLRSMRR